MEMLGWPVKKAEALLKSRGMEVELRETRSRKGVPGGEPRVVQETYTAKGCVLTWARFYTDIQNP